MKYAIIVPDFDQPSKEFEVAVGDYVEIFTDEKTLVRNGHYVWVGRVREFSEDGSFFRVHWCYTCYDVLGGCQEQALEGFDTSVIFDGEDDDGWNPVYTIYRKVKVQDGREMSDLQDDAYDYRMTMKYSPNFHCFQDLQPATPGPIKSQYNVLELYAGAGGLSFVAQTDGDVSITVKHAVETDEDASVSYKLNHPDVTTYPTSVENFVDLCIAYRALLDKYYTACLEADPEDKDKISDLACLTTDDPQIEIPTVSNPAKREYVSIRAALDSGRVTEQDIGYFLDAQKEQGEVPIAEHVDIIIGGPPCQGLSGRNRSVNTTDVFSCERNSEIKQYIRAVECFKPRFVVMENIPEALSRQDGVYMQYAAMNLVRLGYQLRIGILSAACYGAPQMRFRCFLIAALSGEEQLPAFPHPTVRPPESEFQTRKNNLRTLAKTCVVDVDPLYEASLLPPTLIWDAFEDLPQVNNFSMAESANYKHPPQRPYQCYMRRNENRDRTRFLERVGKCFQGLDSDIKQRADCLFSIYNRHEDQTAGEIALGEAHCLYFGDQKQQLWDMFIADKSAEKISQLEVERIELLTRAGREIRCSLQDPIGYKGLCINHRCNPVDVGEYFRIMLISSDGGDFTELPGVLNNGRYCCVGYTHGHQIGTTNGLRYIDSQCPGHFDTQHGDRIIALGSTRCDAKTVFCPTREVLVKRWMIKKMNNKNCSNPRNVYARLKKAEVFGTLLTFVGPSAGYPVIHPTQHRYITIREAARMQGFPDDYLFHGSDNNPSGRSRMSIDSRFKQIGNSVSPPLAAMIGRCIIRAIRRQDPPEQSVVYFPDPDMQEALSRSNKMPYFTECAMQDVAVVDLTENTDSLDMTDMTEIDEMEIEVVDLTGDAE